VTEEIEGAVDPITLTVLWDRFVAICNEMGTVLQRTAKSEAVANGQDFSTALFDREGRLVAQGNFSPGHLGAMPYAIDHVRDEFPLDTWEPGEGVVLNDSHLGTGHLPDTFVVTPIFADDAVEGFTTTTAHQVDVGGMVPGSQAIDATEIYQEGLRLFPTKAVRDGEFEPWFAEVVEANVRLPEMVMGDLRAQHNANYRGQQLVREVIEEYGRETVYTGIDEIIERSERRVRDELAEIPDGTYAFEDVMDPVREEADPVDLRVAVTIDGDRIVFDYAGTDSQTDSAINAFINYTRAYSAFVLKAVTDEDLPHNEGVLRPLTVRAPEGSFFNPDRTAAAGARAIVSQHITDLGVGALAEVVPERLYAASSHVANPVMSGIDSGTGDRFVLFDAVIGGTGALATKDGEEGLCSSVNVTNIPVERHEINYPVRIDRLAFLPDSGGPGRHRGGTGVRKEYTMLTDDIEVTILMNRNRTAVGSGRRRSRSARTGTDRIEWREPRGSLYGSLRPRQRRDVGGRAVGIGRVRRSNRTGSGSRPRGRPQGLRHPRGRSQGLPSRNRGRGRRSCCRRGNHRTHALNRIDAEKSMSLPTSKSKSATVRRSFRLFAAPQRTRLEQRAPPEWRGRSERPRQHASVQILVGETVRCSNTRVRRLITCAALPKLWRRTIFGVPVTT